MTEENNKEKFKLLSFGRGKDGDKKPRRNEMIFLVSIWSVVFILATAVAWLYYSPVTNKPKKDKEDIMYGITQNLDSIKKGLTEKDDGLKKLSGAIETANKELIDNNRGLQKRLEQIEIENKRLLKDGIEKEYTISEKMKEFERLKSENISLQEEIKRLNSEKGVTKSKLDILSKGIIEGEEKLKEEKGRLLKIVQKKDEDISSLSKEILFYKNGDKKEYIKSDEYIKLNEELNRYKEEITNLKSKIAYSEKMFNAKKAEMHYNLGYVFDSQGDYNRAVEEYKKAIQLNPADKNAHYNLAIIYHDHIKNYDLALSHYKRYLEIDPNAADRGKVEGWISEIMK